MRPRRPPARGVVPESGEGEVRTPVGVAGEPSIGWVDGAGMVTLPGRRGQLRWWVGAEDRWHRPETEPSLRHRLIGPAPVTETALRVPGGDVLWRVYGVAAPDGPTVAVEVANTSRAPLAVAIALELPDVAQVCWRGAELQCDGELLLTGPRPPGAVYAGNGDLFATTVAAAAAPPLPAPAVGTAASQLSIAQEAHATVGVWPLAHGATVRFAVPLTERRPRRGRAAAVASAADTAPLDASATADLPPASTVANGWAAQLRAGATFELDGPALAHAVGGERSAALLLAPRSHDPAIAQTLDLWGHDGAAAEVLARAAEVFVAQPAPGAAVALVAALGLHWRLAPDPAFAVAGAEALALALPLAARHALGPAVVDDVASLLEAAGQHVAAERLLRAGPPPAATRRGVPWRRRRERGGPTMDAGPGGTSGMSGTSGAVRPDGGGPAARVRARLVDDSGGSDLVILPGWEHASVGAPVEVLRLPTAYGPLSYAVRWHGPRPALLWEVEADGRDRPSPRLVAPLLDPAWSSQERRGEALLGAPEPSPASPAAMGTESFS